jgi:aspartate aminotransferase
MMWFSSPCNPSGSVYSREELTALAKVEKYPEIIVVADEIYEHINYQELLQHCIYPRNARKTVTVNGVAKAFAMTGWSGYMEVQNSSLKLVLKYKDR